LMKKYIPKADEIIIGTDADEEGELIGYNIVKHFGVLNKTTRMLFMSMTEQEIKDSFDNRGNVREKIALSSELRTWLDKVFGYIFSKYLTSAYKKATNSKGYQKLPVGRVMTPLLNRVIINAEEIKEKEMELKETEPEVVFDFYLNALIPKASYSQYKVDFDDEILGIGESNEGTFWSLKWEDAIDMRNTYSNVIGIVKSVKKGNFIFKTPESGLTIDDIREWGYDKKGIDYTRTTEILQALYIYKLISYPRSDSKILPKEPEYHSERLENVMKYLGIFDIKKEIVDKDVPIMTERFDGSHPAIHPTGKLPEKSLPEDYRIIYDYICKTYVKGFCKPTSFTDYSCEIEFTNLNDEDITRYLCEDEINYWREITFYGYEIVDNPTLINYETPENDIIPEIREGDEFHAYPIIEERIESVHIPSRTTKKDLFKYMIKQNLGTDATRDSILQKLWIENFVRGDKEVYSTVLGINIIEAVKKINPILTKAKLTRQFEDKIEKVKNGSNSEFLKEEIKKDITEIIHDKMDILEDIGIKLAFFGECQKCDGRMKLVSWRRGNESLFFLACENNECDFKSTI
ncbi:MAG: DNA topoisomerase, partial [Candidatus Thorarchaeota archaeon]